MGIRIPSRRMALWPRVGLVLALGTTVGGWVLVRKAEEARIRSAFEAAVAARTALIAQRMTAEEQILEGAAEFASQKGHLSRSEWRDYVSALELPRRYPGIQGLGFAEWVAPKDQKAHEQGARAEGFPAYRVWPVEGHASDPEGFGVVAFLEPLDERNAKALGLDVWSEPARREALAQARDLGAVVATRRVQLVQDEAADKQAGVILYAPVYRRGVRLEDVADRRRALVGWTNIALRMDDHLQGILGQMPEGLLIQVLEDGASGTTSLFPSSGALWAEVQHAWEGTRLMQARTLVVAGRSWTLQAQADARFTASRGGGAHWTFLFGGSLVSLLTFLALGVMARSEIQAEGLADQRLNQLISSDARHAAVIDSLSEGVLVYGEDGRVRACNPSAEALLGLPERDLIGEAFPGEGWKIVDGSGAPLTAEQHPVAQAIRSGKPQALRTLGLTSPGGRFRWLQCSVTPILGSAEGRTFSVVATILDITEQRRAELAVREAEQTFRNLFEGSPNAVSITRIADGRILDANEAWCRLFGWTREEAVGSTFDELRIFAVPGDRIALLEAVRNHRIIDAWPLMASRKDGTHLHASLGVTSMVLNGQECLLTALQDHTQTREAERALRDSEARWKFAIEGAGDGLWDWDATTDQVFYSTRWKAMLGYADAEIGTTLQEWESRVHPADRAAVQEAIQKHLSGETPVYQSEHRLRCKGGDYKWILDRGMVVGRAEDGRATRVIGTHTDLTDRRQAEALLRGAEKAESLGLMASGIAHDFNNLFQVLLGNLELAHLTSDPAGQLVIDRAKLALGRASALSLKLLEFSGGSFTKMEPLELNPLIREVAESRLHGDKLGLQLALAPNLPEILADPKQIRQILGILIENAVEALGPGGGTVTVASEGMPGLSLEEQARGQWAGEIPEGPVVRLSVRDTGGGAGPGVMNRLFDPFFSTKGLGRGLGLPSALGLLRGNRAALQVVDHPGEGMTFRIHLSTERRAERRSSAPSVVNFGEGRAVLVVDDEADLRQVLAESLGNCHGCTVFEAADGVEAIEVFQAHQDEIGLVLMDSVMPRMRGPEAFDGIRRIRPGIPGILISGFSEETGQDLASGHGFAAFLKKPFPLKDLLALIEKVQRAPEAGVDLPLAGS